MIRTLTRLPLLAIVLLLASPALAQDLALEAAEVPDDAVEIEIERDAVDLERRIRPTRPEDVDVIETAMVFTAPGQRALVRCLGFNHQGQVVGRARVYVPAGGLRFLLASDLSNDRDFIGHAKCKVLGSVVPSGILLAPGGVSDVRVVERNSAMLFPLVTNF